MEKGNGCKVAVLAGLAVVGLCLLGGCIKIRLTVKLNEDGSGRLTEEVIFGEKLVNVTRRSKELPQIEWLSSNECVQLRLGNMGKGVSLVSKNVVPLPDGSICLTVVYAFQDIGELRTAAFPYGAGWERSCLTFSYQAGATLGLSQSLRIQPANPPDADAGGEDANNEELSEVETQKIRTLLPIFQDLLEGFELSLRVEVFDPKQWASTTKAHLASTLNSLSRNGGRQVVYRITAADLTAIEDRLLMVVRWWQVGRGPGRLMPRGGRMFDEQRGQGFGLSWRAIQTPHGREYY
jgi:hypothetical protein